MATTTSTYAFQIKSFVTEPPKGIELVEGLPLPQPAAGEVLIEVKASPINPSDLLYASDQYGVAPKAFPARLGLEGAGIVIGVGEGVDQGLVGKRVHFFSSRFNSWGSHAIAEAYGVVPLAESTSFEVGAQLTVNPLSVFAMYEEVGVPEGEYLLQSAASSALGRMVIELSKVKKVKTINLVRRDEHKATLKALGAEHVINTETEDVVARVKEITNGRGALYALDAVGGKTGTDIVNSLAAGGTVLLYGLLTGQPVQVDSGPAIFKGITVKGFWLALWIPHNLAKLAKLYTDSQVYHAEGKFALTVKTFQAKSQFAEAVVHSLTPGKTEKTILVY